MSKHAGTQRRGSVAVIAMLCMVIFALLAIQLAYMSNYSVQLAKNHRSSQRARMAADSGLEYVKHVLSDRAQAIPASVPDQDVLTELQSKLGTYYTGTPVISEIQNGTLYLPRQSDSPLTVSNLRFRTQTRSGVDTETAQLYLVTSVTGEDPVTSVPYTISARFYPRMTNSPVFDYGVLCYGGILQSGGGSLLGDPKVARSMSALPSGYAYELSASVQIAGLAYMANTPQYNVSAKVSGSPSINGVTTSDPSDPTWFGSSFLQAEAPPPPQFDPSVFKSLVPLTDLPATVPNTTMTNIRVPANRNITFSGKTFNGIIYIESPNKISFSNCYIDAVIIFAKSQTATMDTLTLSSTKRIGPIPSDPSLDYVRQVTEGYSILAPTANLTCSGNMGNSTAPISSIICNRLTFSGGCQVNMNNGSVIVYDPTARSCNLSGCTAINFTRSADYHVPRYGFVGDVRRYFLDLATYTEGN